MNFEERDKPFIKNVSSNLIRLEQAEETIMKIQYATEVVKDAMLLSLVFKTRNDHKHSLEYVNTALNVNRMMTLMIQRERKGICAKDAEE